VDTIDLLFRRLVLAAQAADALARPIEVGEILDSLVTYRAARRDGGIETHDDYLHAMMQILAGERELVFADDLMQDDLRNEVASSNPDLGVLRTYASAKVRLSTNAVQRVLAGDTAIDLRPATPVATPVIAYVPTPAPASPVSSATPAARPSAAVGVSAPEPQGAECPYCTHALPTDRVVKYCPGCGINLRMRRCPGCSTEIESEWKYCVTCGRSAA
jgi:hypothetical protein